MTTRAEPAESRRTMRRRARRARRTRPPTRRWPWFVVAGVLVAALGALGVVAYQAADVRTHTVPSLAGLDIVAARAAVADFGWEIEVEEQFVDTAQAGAVVGQEPVRDSELEEGGTLRLIVSKGPRPVLVPDLSGETVDDLETTLDSAGLVLGAVNTLPDEDVAQGLVVTWFVDGDERPEQAPKFSEVDVVVSSGPAPRTVPEVARQEVDEATDALETLGLAVEEREVFDSSVPAGLVVGTEPAAGEEVARGSTVTLLVSKGPDLVTVPDVSGDSMEDAIAALEAAGLVVNDVTGNPKKRVIATDPPAGTQVERGTEVLVILAR